MFQKIVQSSKELEALLACKLTPNGVSLCIRITDNVTGELQF